MKEHRTYNVGPVDLFDLPFAISVGDLNPDFRLNEAYYHNGKIDGNWIDGLGRKNSNGPVSINAAGLSSFFKSEKLEKAKRIFACRENHQKSIATWFFVNFRGKITYLIIRQNDSSEPHYLEYFSSDSSILEVPFYQLDDLIEKLNDSNIVYFTPKPIIKDLLNFVANLFDFEGDFSSLQFNKDVIFLSNGHKMIQINSSKTSGLAYIYSWEQPRHGAFKIPKIITEKIDYEQLDARSAYYLKSGFTE